MTILGSRRLATLKRVREADSLDESDVLSDVDVANWLPATAVVFLDLCLDAIGARPWWPGPSVVNYADTTQTVLLPASVFALAMGDGPPIVHSFGVPVGGSPAPAVPAATKSLLVQFAPDATAQDTSAALALAGARVVETVHARSAESGELVLVEPDGGATAALADALSAAPGVASVELNGAVRLLAIANDSLFVGGNMWGMYGDLTAPANVFGSQAGEAWAVGNTGKSTIVVGDVDTGLDYTHPDLYLNVWLNQGELPKALALVDVDQDGLITFRDLNQTANASFVLDRNGNARIDAGDLLADGRWVDLGDQDGNGYVDDLIGWDFVNNDNNPYDDNGHGSHTAGTIGAIGGNATGVAGVNWSVQVMPLKFLDDSGSGTLANAIRALDYYTAASVLDQARQWVSEFIGTNNSWGGGGFSSALLAAIVRGARQDALFVSAAGNGGTDSRGDSNDTLANYPSNYSTVSDAGFEAVVAVAALASNGALASYSNYGRQTVDLGAPGSGIWSTVPGGYASFSGTSMAAPHVTGALALYASLYPDYSAAQLRSALLGSTLATASLATRTVTGGRLDIGALAASGPPQSQSLPDLTIGNLSLDAPASIVNFQWSNLGTTDATSAVANIYLSPDGAITTTDLLLGTVTASSVAAGSDLADSVPVTLPVQVVAGTYHLGAIADPGGALPEASETNNVSNALPIALGTSASDALTGTAVSDSLFGFAGDDTINGGTGIDVMLGGAGNDTLDGGLGDDTMLGGPGDDTYHVESLLDSVTELANQGIDTVLASVSEYVLPANVEELTLVDPAVSGEGNSLDNVITGNALQNTLIGHDGNDILDGETNTNPAEGDILLGGVGNDTYILRNNFDLVDEGADFPGFPGGSLDIDTIVSNINFFWDMRNVGEILQIAEGAPGSGFGDPGATIIGSMFDNALIGNNGTNIMFGRGGSDRYRAGSGIDWISFSTLGLDDGNSYIGVDGINTIVVEQRTTGPYSYDIVFDFDVTKDLIDVSAYGLGSFAAVQAKGANDGSGNSYYTLGDGLDYLFLVGVTTAQVTSANFIV
ncbi:MAG: S8 family serine peptidase [Reyranella sp.]